MIMWCILQDTKTSAVIVMSCDGVFTEETPRLALVKRFTGFTVFAGCFVFSTVYIHVHLSYYLLSKLLLFRCSLHHVQAGICNRCSIRFQ